MFDKHEGQRYKGKQGQSRICLAISLAVLVPALLWETSLTVKTYRPDVLRICYKVQTIHKL